MTLHPAAMKVQLVNMVVHMLTRTTAPPMTVLKYLPSKVIHS